MTTQRINCVGGVLCFSVLVASCSGSPSSPTPASARTLAIAGSLAFGDVVVGASGERTITLSNGGNSTLTVSAIAVSGDIAEYLAVAWAGGQIPAGGSQAVTVRFSPARSGAFTGSITVNGDHTSGVNVMAVSGGGVRSFAGSWAGGYRVDQCSGAGALYLDLCGPRDPLIPIGGVFRFSMQIEQNGSSVSGMFEIGGVAGPITGTVSTADRVNLRGSLTSPEGYAAVVTATNFERDAIGLLGTFTYDLTFRGVEGSATFTASLRNVFPIRP